MAVIPAARADEVADALDAGRAAYGKGDSLRALLALQKAGNALATRLGSQLAAFLPPPLPGWDAGPADTQPLDAIGGGLRVARGFQHGDASLNVAIVIDNPAVAAASALFRPQAPEASGPSWSRVSIDGGDALLRYDATQRDGEVVMIISERALLQVEGSEIAKSDDLLSTARSWNFAGIRKLLAQ